MTTTATRYLCKSCGAESPTGIGYAANGQTDFPAPAASCTEPHRVTSHVTTHARVGDEVSCIQVGHYGWHTATEWCLCIDSSGRGYSPTA